MLLPALIFFTVEYHNRWNSLFWLWEKLIWTSSYTCRFTCCRWCRLCQWRWQCDVSRWEENYWGTVRDVYSKNGTLCLRCISPSCRQVIYLCYSATSCLMYFCLLIFVVSANTSDCLGDRLQNDLQCVEWDVEPYSLTHSLTVIHGSKIWPIKIEHEAKHIRG